ncbi:MAG TPA: hypothetical protein VJA94_07170 [Candidatus Angelobacter sp.]
MKTYSEQGMEPLMSQMPGYEGATAAVKHVEEGTKPADKKQPGVLVMVQADISFGFFYPCVSNENLKFFQTPLSGSQGPMAKGQWPVF